MNPKSTGYSTIKSVYNLTFKSFKNNPRLFIPFVIFASFEAVSLIILYLAPRAPLRAVLGPLIKTFWSESYLHYPNNFILLPNLAYLARMGLAIAIGALLGAMAISIALDIYHKKPLNLKNSFFSVLKNYPSFFIIAAISVLLYYLTTIIIGKLLMSYFYAGHSKLLFIPARIWIGPILLCVNFALAIILQSFFIYAIPIIVIEKEKLLKALIKSVLLFFKQFVPTIILVGLPMLLTIPLLILNLNNAFLIGTFFPELILYIAFLSIIVNSLIIDPLITISTAYYYLTVKKK